MPAITTRRGRGSPGARRRSPCSRCPAAAPPSCKVKGGDNSVQEYGAEAGGSELREAAGIVHSFLVARVRGEWARACSLLAAHASASLEGLAASAPGSRGKGCPAALAAVTKAIAPSLARGLTTVDAASLRQGGGQAFLIYTGPPGRTVYAMPLVAEEGTWRLGAIEAAALPGATASHSSASR